MGAIGLPNHRKEFASALLESWAFALLNNKLGFEMESGYCGESVICEFNHSKAYKPFCFKIKTNATQTRNASVSKIPLGGVGQSQTKAGRILRVNELMEESLSDLQLYLVFVLFVPRARLGKREDGTLFKDYEISQQIGIPGKRASQWKLKAIKIVAEDFIPVQEAS